MFRREYVPPRATGEEVVETRAPLTVVLVRTILTAAGAGAIGLGAFLVWFRPAALAGTDLSWRAYFSTGALQTTVDIFRSAGGIMILVAIVALMGLVFRSGWVTRLAGVLGLVGFALMTITIARAPLVTAGTTTTTAGNGTLDAIGPGLWLVLAGSIVTVIAGFTTGVRRVARTSVPTAVPAATATGATAATAAATGMLKTDHECHVMPNADGGWDIVGPGRERDAMSFRTQHEAEERARELLATNGGGELIVHKRNGKVRARQIVAAA
jgi:hypothetical protein